MHHFLQNIKHNLLPHKAEMTGNQASLVYQVIAECKNSKARVGKMNLKHGEVDTPVFMPVGTQVILNNLRMCAI